MGYEQVIAALRDAYKGSAEERELAEITPWKMEERQKFLTLLQKEGKTTLLEVGAGTGRDSKYFQDHGLTVTATDLTPEMVRLCREKGLTAYVMDFLQLDFPAHSFDALYALNSLLHVPTQDLPTVLQKLQSLLQPTGLFYLGVYGGREHEGIWSEDKHEPKRFFCYHTDEYMQTAVKAYFDILYFQAIVLTTERDESFHFQSMILRRR